MKKLFTYEVSDKAARFLSCENVTDLHQLGFDTEEMQRMAVNPPYYTFEVPKKKGGVRKIEAPEEGLKFLQKKLNGYLQCIYYTLQTKAAYGYIIRVRNTVNYKDILGNARQHHGAKYLLNADQFNPAKTKFFDDHHTKKVTGLLLNATIDIDPQFISPRSFQI